MKSGRIKKYLKTRVKLKLFERKLEFWNLFENWDLKKYLKIGVLKIKLWIGVLEIKFEEIGVLKINRELKFWKLNYENWNLGNYFKMEF